MNNKSRVKGSAILVVILSSIAFFIYAMSVFSESEHFDLMQNRYEKQIVKKYNKDEMQFYKKILVDNSIFNNI